MSMKSNRIPTLRNGGPQRTIQRPDLLHARRQPAWSPAPACANHVAGRGNYSFGITAGGRQTATTLASRR